jgi:hypothetical protein
LGWVIVVDVAVIGVPSLITVIVQVVPVPGAFDKVTATVLKVVNAVAGIPTSAASEDEVAPTYTILAPDRGI